MVSPALSNSSIQEVSASSDNFSLTEDGDGKRTCVLCVNHLIFDKNCLEFGDSECSEYMWLVTGNRILK